jgi:hypothetical protein
LLRDCVFFKALKQFAATSSANVGDFLQRRLTMTSDGRLLCGGDPTAAFGLVTGYLPTGLRMALWQDARDNDVAVRDFVAWFRKNVKKMLWRPTWEAAKAGDQAVSNGGDDVDEPCATCGASTLLPSGVPMRDVLVCDDCNAEVHLACSGFKKVPRGFYNCGCRGGGANDDLDDNAYDYEDDDDDRDDDDGDDVDTESDYDPDEE